MLKRIVICASLSMSASVVQAGTVMETISRDLNNPGASATTVTTQAQDGRMRVTTGADGSVMIFKEDALYSFSEEDKSYIVMDRASMKRMADQINPALKQMQEQLAKMPPEQRAQVEKMLGDRMPVMSTQEQAQEIRKTSRTGKAGGHACKYVEVRQGGVLTDELCVAPASALKGSQALMEAAANMSKLMQEMVGNLDAPWLSQLIERQAANFDELGGVPVLTRHFSDGEATHETTLQSIRTESLPASLFEVPAGYTRKDMMTRN